MRELFVYYRVRAGHESQALAAVRSLHDDLRALHPWLVVRLLRRTDPRDGRQTWMETYALDRAADSNGIGPELQADIEARAHALLPLLEGSRHVEAFAACD